MVFQVRPRSVFLTPLDRVENKVDPLYADQLQTVRANRFTAGFCGLASQRNELLTMLMREDAAADTSQDSSLPKTEASCLA